MICGIGEWQKRLGLEFNGGLTLDVDTWRSVTSDLVKLDKPSPDVLTLWFTSYYCQYFVHSNYFWHLLSTYLLFYTPQTLFSFIWHSLTRTTVLLPPLSYAYCNEYIIQPSKRLSNGRIRFPSTTFIFFVPRA